MSEGTFAINKDKGVPLKTSFNADDKTCTLFTSVAEFSPPPGADAGTVDYPDAVTEVYSFRKGGITGTVLKTLTLVYSDSSKTNLTAWSAV